MKSYGFTLVEALVIVFIIVVGVVGVAALITGLIRPSANVASRLEASYLAQEGIEIVRNMRDTNFLAIRSGNCDPIANPEAWKGVGTCTGGATLVNLTSCATGCRADYDDPLLNTFYGGEFLNVVNGFYSYDIGTPTPYERKITIVQSGSYVSGDDALEVDVEVSWGTQSVTASTVLYNWLKIPPPVRSDGQPSGTLAAGTTQATLSLTTDQAATCRYATSVDVYYDGMIDVFATTGGTSHSTDVPVADGTSYTFYIRCGGDFGNKNTTDFLIEFSVAPSS